MIGIANGFTDARLILLMARCAFYRPVSPTSQWEDTCSEPGRTLKPTVTDPALRTSRYVTVHAHAHAHAHASETVGVEV